MHPNIDPNKPTVPEVAALVKAWYAKPGNAAGGIFHVILDDGNSEQFFAESALEEAVTSGDPESIELAQKLVAMSPTQRLKLSHVWSA